MKPNKLKILGKPFRVQYVPKMEDVNTTGSPDILLGEVAYQREKIRIFGGLHKYDNTQVLWHEIIHAINSSLQIGINETQIDQIATGIANVLIDNKMLKE